MRLKRKIAALVTAASMVLGLFGGVASAGTFSDVPADKSYAGAVERLAGLGVVQGVGGGKYDPEGQYTRAQFAALAVRLRGIKTAGSGATDFKDVPATHWASGWINLATGLGIIKGMGDGTFHPDDPVTHAQALTMLLRVMGYEPSIKKGPWPAIVLAKAAELELDKGVNVVANLPATRGEVAMFADNALDQPLMVLDTVTEDGKEIYKKAVDDQGNTTKSIAKTYLKSTSTEGTLTSSPELFAGAKDKVDVDDGIGTGDPEGTDTFTLVSGTKYAGLLGHKVKAWRNTDGKVFFIEDKSGDAVKTVKAKADNLDDTNTSGTLEAGEKIKVGSTWYKLATGAKLIKNLAYVTSIAVADLDQSTDVDNGEFTVILNDDNEVSYIVAMKHTARVVDSANASLENVTFTSESGGGALNLKDYTVTWVGAASKIGDLQKDDVVEYVDDSTNKKAHIVVTRNNKSGTLTKRYTDKIEVGGAMYDLAPGVTVDSGLQDKTVTVYLNSNGKVAFIKSGTTGTAATAKPVALVLETPTCPAENAPNCKVKLHKSDGTNLGYVTVADNATIDETTDFTFDYDANHNAATLVAHYVDTNSVIEYDVDQNNRINYIKVLTRAGAPSSNDGDTDSVTGQVYRINMKPKKDPNQLLTSADAFIGALTSDSTVFDVRSSNYQKAVTVGSLLSWNQVTGWYAMDGAKVRAVVITGAGGSVTPDTFGFVMNKYETSKKYFSINIKGTTSDYEVDPASEYANYDKETLDKSVIWFTPATGKTSAITAASTTVVDSAYEIKIKKIEDAGNGTKIVTLSAFNKVTGVEDPTKITSGPTSYLVNSETQVFHLNGDNAATYGEIGHLAVGQVIKPYAKTDAPNVAKAIVISD